MNVKQNGYKNVNDTVFFGLSHGNAYYVFFYDLETEARMSDVYLSLPDLDFIVKSKMAVILHIYN